MESKQTRPKAAEKKQELGSAFAQEGKGKTMAAPAFGLTAGEITKGKSAEKSEDPTRDGFYNILSEASENPSAYVNAVRYLMRKLNMYNDQLMDLKVVDALDHGDVAATDGRLGPDTIQRITVTMGVFAEDYSYIVRTLGHEYQHCLYHWSHTADNYNRKESEFQSYYWEVFGEGCLAHEVNDNILDCIGYAQKNFNGLPKDLKQKYQPQMEELLAKKAELSGK